MNLTNQPNRPVITVHVGDMHIGSGVALCPPRVPLDDGGYHAAGPVSRWYWVRWLDFWEDTARLKRRTGATVVGIFGGDLRDGDHHNTIQLWSASSIDQDKAVMQALKVASEVVDSWVFIRGTQAHDGPGAAANERYAMWVQLAGWGKVLRSSSWSYWVYQGVHGGVKFDVAHAPSTKGWKPHTQGPATARQAFETWTEYVEDGLTPPDVVIRHHVHYASGPGVHQDVRAYIIPAWQAMGHYVAGRGVRSGRRVRRPGGLRLICDGGRLVEDWKLYKPRNSTPWD